MNKRRSSEGDTLNFTQVAHRSCCVSAHCQCAETTGWKDFWVNLWRIENELGVIFWTVCDERPVLGVAAPVVATVAGAGSAGTSTGGIDNVDTPDDVSMEGAEEEGADLPEYDLHPFTRGFVTRPFVDLADDCIEKSQALSALETVDSSRAEMHFFG